MVRLLWPLLVAGASAIAIGPRETSDPCTKLRQALDEQGQLDDSSVTFQVPGTLAYDCLSNIPLDKETSLLTVSQLRQYLSFYSAQTYWLNPPTPELELKAVDLNATLDAIERGVKNGEYKTDYAVNKDLHELFNSFRDGHTMFIPTCLSLFIYRHDYPLAAVSSAPDALPKIHLIKNGDGPKIGREVSKINGKTPEDYLKQLAASNLPYEYTDPDTRWNLNLYSHDSNELGMFAARPVLYDPEPLHIVLDDGTEISPQWTATLNPGSMASILDADGNTLQNTTDWHDTDTLYHKVCLRSDIELQGVLRDPGSEESGAKAPYAKAPYLSYNNLDNTTAVLIVNTFEPAYTDLESFESDAKSAIKNATAAGMKRLIIDIPSNGGGYITLGERMAQYLFPQTTFSFMSNVRWNPFQWKYKTQTAANKTDKTILDAYTREGNVSFGSWAEELAPQYRDGDYFSPMNYESLYTEIPTELDMSEERRKAQPFKSQDIIVVSSGRCASTCTIFTEALRSQGVKFVATGGRPQIGPMQAVGGVKGAQVLTMDAVVADQFNLTGEGGLNWNSDYLTPLRVRTSAASFNYRNQWRTDDKHILPLEFLYTPADYRIFLTEETILNSTLRWKAAADVAWGSAKSMTGGPYTPVEGFDGSGWGGVNSTTKGETNDDADADDVDEEGESPSTGWGTIGGLVSSVFGKGQR